jgi:hypothetical protein
MRSALEVRRMRVFSETAVGFGAVAMLVAGACLNNRGAAPDSPSLREPWQSLYEVDRAAELERQWLILLGRVAAKIELHRMLLRGELSLPEAAYRLREILRDDPWAYARLVGQFPGCSEAEALCRHLLHYAEDDDRDGPWANRVIACLEAELNDLIRSGALGLPCAPTPEALK